MINDIVTACCECKQIYNPILDEWVDNIELYNWYTNYHLVYGESRISHGLCPTDYAVAIEKVREYDSNNQRPNTNI